MANKNKKIEMRVSEEEKEFIEFMASYKALKVSQYLLSLAKQDFNSCELKNYAKKLDVNDRGSTN